MNKDIIGIKLADGSFYPVLTTGKASEKQLTLTTARDGQTSIRLHLYRSAFGAMEDAEYIDSLRIDGLAFHMMNEPTVSLKVSLDESGTISAELADSETGSCSSKTVSVYKDAAFSAPEPEAEDTSGFTDMPEISSMPDIPDFDIGLATETPADDDSSDFDIPEPQDSSTFDVPPLTEEDLDFDLDDTSSVSNQADSSEDFSMQSSPFTDSSLYDGLSQETKKKKTGLSIPLAICIICAVICVCVLGIILYINPPKWFSKSKEEVPEYNFDGQLIPDTQDEDQPSPNEDIILVSDEPIIPEQPVIVEPDAADEKQIKHLVKWGDTLWDIAGCYYKNPWAYPRIAKANNIKDPDYIISGTILIIPR